MYIFLWLCEIVTVYGLDLVLILSVKTSRLVHIKTQLGQENLTPLGGFRKCIGRNNSTKNAETCDIMSLLNVTFVFIYYNIQITIYF